MHHAPPIRLWAYRPDGGRDGLSLTTSPGGRELSESVTYAG